MPESKTSPRRLNAVERQKRALQLRREGRGFGEIAVALGYRSRSGAFKALSAALLKTLKPAAEEYRQLEDQRLDVALSAIWHRVRAGDLDAIHAMLALLDRRMRLLGLATMVPTEVSGPAGGPIQLDDVTSLTDDERADRVAAILTAAKRRLDARLDRLPAGFNGSSTTDSHHAGAG